MESSRSTERLPTRFESLNDDTLGLILQFVGKRSYKSFGGLNKQCKEVYLNNTKGMEKETFLFGYAPLSHITDKIERDGDWRRIVQNAVSIAIVYYNRQDILIWAIHKQKNYLLKAICNFAAEKEKIDLLDKVWNNVEDNDNKRYLFRDLNLSAIQNGKLNVLKWLKLKGIPIYKRSCADHLYIIHWIHATRKGNLEILQWLHDEGCPWHHSGYVCERKLKPEVIYWCCVNGYGDRINRLRR